MNSSSTTTEGPIETNKLFLKERAQADLGRMSSASTSDNTHNGHNNQGKLLEFWRSNKKSIQIFSTEYLKITEKISFNIASEASYVYILSGQKLIKNA